MAAPSRMPNKEITRMCRYISGLLSYYGVMKLDELHRRVQLLFDCSPDLAKFRAQLKRKSLDDSTDDAMFDVVGDEIHHLDVEDADWVWSEQASRPDYDFWPVSTEAATLAGGEDEELLFGPTERKFCALVLGYKCGHKNVESVKLKARKDVSNIEQAVYRRIQSDGR